MIELKIIYLSFGFIIGFVIGVIFMKSRKNETKTVDPISEAIISELKPTVIDEDTFDHLLRRSRVG